MAEPAPPAAAEPANPLAEASHSSLEELFSRDLAAMPREARREALLSLVRGLREARLRWKVEEASGATRASKAKKVPKTTATSLSDLGLD